MKEILKQQVALVEVFLYEFCEIHGIDETQLMDHVYMVGDAQNSSIGVVNITTNEIEFGVKPIITEGTPQLFIFGTYATQMERYPKTTSLIVS